MTDKLVEVTRGDLAECIHRGHIAVVDLKGNILYKLGNPYYVTYFRSAAKPIQAVAVLESGAAEKFKFTDKEIAVFCASHAGEKQHTETVMEILGKMGLDEEVLDCGIHPPLDKRTRLNMFREGKEPTPLHSNCSGKHSGMIATAKTQGFDLEDYRGAQHPLQQQMLQVVADFAQMKKEDITIGVDGCGVPVFGLPLCRMALSFAKLSKPDIFNNSKRAEAVKRITRSMIKHPSIVAGSRKFDSKLLEAAEGKLVGKIGAEGVFCIGIMDKGIGIAVKVEDGNARALWPSVVHVLKQLNLLDSRQLKHLKKYYPVRVKNFHKEIVGEIRPVFKLIPSDEKI